MTALKPLTGSVLSCVKIEGAVTGEGGGMSGRTVVDTGGGVGEGAAGEDNS